MLSNAEIKTIERRANMSVDLVSTSAVQGDVLRLIADRETLMAVIENDCENEKLVRAACKRVLPADKVDGDSHYVPSVVDLLVDMLIADRAAVRRQALAEAASVARDPRYWTNPRIPGERMPPLEERIAQAIERLANKPAGEPEKGEWF